MLISNEEICNLFHHTQIKGTSYAALLSKNPTLDPPRKFVAQPFFFCHSWIGGEPLIPLWNDNEKLFWSMECVYPHKVIYQKEDGAVREVAKQQSFFS